MGSAYVHPEVVTSYLESELTQGRIATSPITATVQVSSFGVIPKRHQPNKWRLIVNLSSPQGQSVNDGISRELCTFSYVSVVEIASAILALTT